MISAHSEEARQYIRQHVSPLIEQLLTDLVVHRPKDVVHFCQQWFGDYQKGRQSKQAQHIQSDSEDEQATELLLERTKSKKYMQKRQAITTEVFGLHNRTVDIQPEFYKKNEETKTRILIRLKDLFMFRNLDDQQTNSLIDSMREHTLEASATLVSQDEEANRLFVVDKGELEAVAVVDGELVSSEHYFPGDSFGEMALLYDNPWRYSIQAKKTSVVYSLDRHFFTSVNRLSARQKRELLVETLPKMHLFREMDSDEINQLVDVAKELCAYSSEYVVKQGQTNQRVFVVARGRLSAYKKLPSNELEEQNVDTYTEGGYFGIEGFVSGTASPISVVSLTNSKLFYIERQAIVRIIGPVERILQRTTAKYNRQLASSPRA